MPERAVPGGTHRNNKRGSGAKELTLYKANAPSAGPEEGKGSTGGFRETALELRSGPESSRPEQKKQQWPQGCSAGRAQPSPAIASARLSLLSPMGWPLRSIHLLSPHRVCPIPLLPADLGLAPAHPSTKIKIFLMTGPGGLQGNRRVLFPGFQTFLQSSI